MKTGQIKYTLNKPIKYTEDGQFVESDHLILREPTIHHAQKSLKLRQIIKKSEFELGASVAKLGLIEDDIGSKAGEQLKPPETLAEQWLKDSKDIISQVTLQLENSSIDMHEFAEIFWKMSYMQPPVCLINGNIGMKKGYKDNISLEDYIDVPIFYCCFFVTLSGNDRKIISGEQSDSPTAED